MDTDKSLTGQSQTRRDAIIRNVGVAVALVIVAGVAGAAVPYVFQSGEVIRASEINANFQYVESLASQQSGGNLVRVGVFIPQGGPQVTVFTVPANATSPYVLRTITTSGCFIAIAVSASGGSGAIKIPGQQTIITGLDIPFAPGESINASCEGGASNAWFVFST